MEKIKKNIADLKWLREEIIGRNILFETPFGKKPLVYADYTASGRSIQFIENYLMHILEFYANTHTEDDVTGKTMTELVHKAENTIKRIVNAGKTGKIIFSGTGATGGITRLQQILGVYWSPATHHRMDILLNSCVLPNKDKTKDCHKKLLRYIEENKPIVFVGPYEHHSNELMWRETLCEVVEIPLNLEGEIDLAALQKITSAEKYANRQKIGSFSAASNVSGIITPVYEVARILHQNDAIACFDFAACAPYIEIDMNRDDESYFDAIFLSPHKFLGGPGTSGLLVFNEKIYQKELPPSIAAGGTVKFVTMENESYIDDIEAREKPGTPGVLQNIKSALVFELKEKIGIQRIEIIEKYFLEKFYDEFKDEKDITFLGTTDANKKINIIPFNILHRDRILHPKFVTKLLNDLFGIQTRAGCSCAGPYGHRLLDISSETSKFYQCLIGVDNYEGVKPGWVRLNCHYSLALEEFDYIIKAIKFIIKNGHLFLKLYKFNFYDGEWKHLEKNEKSFLQNDFNEIIKMAKFEKKTTQNITEIFTKNFEIANQIIADLKDSKKYKKFEEQLEKMMFFYVINYEK